MIPTIKSLAPPGLVQMSDGLYIVPKWIKVPDGTTIVDVLKKWKKVEFKTQSHSDIHEKIKSSNGKDSYTVTLINNRWNCTCTGFGFRRDCKHVREIKLKYKIK